MSLIEVLLSSAVIVAVIQYFQGEKNNKLQIYYRRTSKMEKRNKRDNYRNRDSRLSNNRKVFDGFGKKLNAYGYCPEVGMKMTSLIF